MNTSIVFNCKKCGAPVRTEQHLGGEKIVCSKCGYQNTSPKANVLPDSVKVKAKDRYFGD